MGKPLGGWTVKRFLTALAWCAFLVSFPSPAFALTREVQVNVTVNVAQILEVAYTGSSLVLFNVDSCDLGAGSKTSLDQGDVNWYSNAAPWIIKVQRTEWDTPNKSADPGLILQVKYGPGSTGNWVTVNTYPTAWINGATPGNGTFEGVDWEIEGLSFLMPPGAYYCTVTISIIGGG
jgi:hypothetical protein